MEIESQTEIKREIERQRFAQIKKGMVITKTPHKAPRRIQSDD